jgi:hypothetical protein
MLFIEMGRKLILTFALLLILIGFSSALTLQEYINNAEENSVVNIPKGAYTGARVNKSIVLDSSNAVITGELLIDADNITVKDFIFRDQGRIRVIGKEDGTISILNNDFFTTNITVMSIVLESTAHYIIRRNEFQENIIGVFIKELPKSLNEETRLAEMIYAIHEENSDALVITGTAEGLELDVQKLIDDAAPGSVVRIYGITINKNLTINKKITLDAEEEASIDAVITVTAKDAKIKDFDITPNGKIILQNDAYIENNHFMGFGEQLIAEEGYARILSNTFEVWGLQNSMIIINSDRALIRDNEFIGIEGNETLVEFAGTGNYTVQNNKFLDFGTAILINGKADYTIRQNTFINGRTAVRLEVTPKTVNKETTLEKMVSSIKKNNKGASVSYTDEISPPAGTIQEMINEADEGDKLTIPAGVYNEDIVIDKTLKLYGKGATIKGTVFITADDVRFEKFTLTEYGVNDGDPVVHVLGDDAEVLSNTFIKTEDAFEIVVEGQDALIRGNYINGTISTDSGMIKVYGSADNTEIIKNTLYGSERGQWSPLQLLLLEADTDITIKDNTIRNAYDKAIFISGAVSPSAIITLRNNKFYTGSRVIYIRNPLKKLNGYSDMEDGAENVEDKNTDSEVQFGF